MGVTSEQSYHFEGGFRRKGWLIIIWVAVLVSLAVVGFPRPD